MDLNMSDGFDDEKYIHYLDNNPGVAERNDGILMSAGTDVA